MNARVEHRLSTPPTHPPPPHTHISQSLLQDLRCAQLDDMRFRWEHHRGAKMNDDANM